MDAKKVDSIISDFVNKEKIHSEDLCFLCEREPHDPHVSWIVRLQNCLEDAGLPIDQFCLAAKKRFGDSFGLENGRLVYLDDACMSTQHVRRILEEM